MARDRRIGRLLRFLSFLTLLAVVPPGEVLAGGSLRPDLVETAVVVKQRTVRAGTALHVTDTIRNRGGATAPRSTTGYYISRDLTHGPDDLRLGGRAIGSLRPGALARGSSTVSIPRSAAPGSYRVLACADDRHRIRESDERNNCRPAAHPISVKVPPGGDRTPPVFAGLKAATTCIPGPTVPGRSTTYHLTWDPAADDVTPSGEIVYDVYQATSPGAEDFRLPTYSTAAGATSFTTPQLSGDETFYFVVRASDRAGNRETNQIERRGVNLCV